MENKNVLRQKISNEKFYEQVGIVLRKKISNVEDGIYFLVSQFIKILYLIYLKNLKLKTLMNLPLIF